MSGSSTGFAKYPEDEAQQSTDESLKNKAVTAATRVRDKAAELSQGAAEKVDENREPAASAVESAASTLHEKAEALPGGPTVTRLAHQTADKLQSTADYVREHDTRAMLNDLERFVKDHPGESLVVAIALGFLVGRAFTRD